MEKEQLAEELTEKISGGAGVEPKKQMPHGSFKSSEINVKCAKCGKEFKYYKDDPYTPMAITAVGYWEREIKRRTCPSCGYVNSEKELGI